MATLTKSALRKDALAKRSRFSGKDRARLADLLASQLLRLPVIQQAKTISAYVPFGGEINILPTLGALFECEECAVERVVMPRVVVEENRLALHVCDSRLFTDISAGGAFVDGYGGILEPPALWPEVSLDEVDVIIVPGVAFDRSCMRIGYGKGFYDRLLAEKRKDAASIGVIFDELLYDELPTENHDMAMDFVVSPHEILMRSE